VYDDQDTLQDERRWLWQGQLRIVAELDGDGELVKRFVYGTKVNVPEYMVTYDPVSHLETGTYRILTDQLGSLRLVVDVSAGTVVQRMRHDEWGNVLENVGSGITPFGFAGGLYDPATGLVRFGARDYDPETGRWTGKDPILFGGGRTALSAFCSGDPVNTSDPFGTEEKALLEKIWEVLRGEAPLDGEDGAWKGGLLDPLAAAGDVPEELEDTNRNQSYPNNPQRPGFREACQDVLGLFNKNALPFREGRRGGAAVPLIPVFPQRPFPPLDISVRFDSVIPPPAGPSLR